MRTASLLTLPSLGSIGSIACIAIGCAQNAPPANSTLSSAPAGGQARGRDAINLTASNLPISSAVRAGELVVLSGIVGADPATGQMAEGLAAQTEQIFKNARAVLAAAGLDLSRVVKCNVYMTNIADFPAFNEVYGKQFEKPYPARTTVGIAGLPKGAVIEIEMIAR